MAIPTKNINAEKIKGNLSINGVSATTISATTYLGLPIDIRVTGGTYSNGTAIFTNNTGGTFTVTGFTTGGTSSDTFVTGFTYSNNNLTIFQNQSQSPLQVNINSFTGLTINGTLSATTLSATTYLGLPPSISADTYWISGSTGAFSIKAINDTGLDATGDYAVAIGFETLAAGEASFAMGRQTIAEGGGSLAMGRGNRVNGNYSFAGGSSNVVNGNNSFVFGGGSAANGNSTIILGDNMTGDSANTVYVPNVQFDLNAPSTMSVGRMEWNDTDGTVDLRLKGNNVTLQIGQEQVVRVVNKTNANLLESDYNVVRFRRVDEGGAQGQRPAVVLAQGNNDPNSMDTIGIVTENITNNEEGFITTSGIVRDINTTGSLQGETWVDGDLLYLSPFTAGGLTKVKPTAPMHSVVIGYVVYAHANNGKIYVKVDNGYELDELHNVNIIGTPTNGQALTYSTALSAWTNTNISGGTSGTDIFVTGGTYNVPTGTATFTNNSGGTFNVLGFLTAATGTNLVTSLKNLADGSTVSGTTSITQSLSLFIPAGTFIVGDAFRYTMRVRKTGTAGITTVRAYVNTANNLTGALQLSIASSTSVNHLFAQHKREVWVKSATNTETLVSTGNSPSDDVSISNFSNTNINWAVNQWLILTINNASAGDSTIGAGIVVEKI
jgi:hypothetical protein